MADQPHPVDVHVGARVRLCRTLGGFSQQKLAATLGLTFQQIQKYEKGTNRISASKMWEICQILDVTPSYLFEGLEELVDAASAEQPSANGDEENYDLQSLFRREVLELVRAYDRVEDQAVRKKIHELVKALGSS